MYTKVLIPLDGSKSAEAAVDEALELSPAVQAVHLAVVDIWLEPLHSEGYRAYRPRVRELRALAQRDVLRRPQKRLEAAGVRVSTSFLPGDPVTAIAELARKDSVGLILLGAGGGWLERYFGPAHYANRLARRVDATVVTVRNGGRKSRRRPKISAMPSEVPGLVPRRV